MAKRESAVHSAKPVLIPQPGGRGALYAGGVPGNKGGGRHPSEVRKAFLEALVKGPDALQRIIEDPSSRDADRIAAIAAAAKIGLPVQIEAVPPTPLTPEERQRRLTAIVTKKHPS